MIRQIFGEQKQYVGGRKTSGLRSQPRLAANRSILGANHSITIPKNNYIGSSGNAHLLASSEQGHLNIFDVPAKNNQSQQRVSLSQIDRIEINNDLSLSSSREPTNDIIQPEDQSLRPIKSQHPGQS